MREGEVVHFFYTFKSCLTERGIKVLRPIVDWQDDLTVLCAYQLSVVDHSRALHNLGDIIKTPYLRPTVGLLEEPKAPIGRKLGVAHYQEGD